MLLRCEAHGPSPAPWCNIQEDSSVSIRICTFCAPAYDICIKNSLHSHAAEFSLGFVSRCPDLKLKSGFMQEFKPVRQRHSQLNAANSEFNHNRIFALSPYTPLKSSARTSQTVNNGRALQRNCPQPEQAEGSPQPHDAAGSRRASVLPCPRDSAGRSLHGHRPPVIPAPTDAPRRHQRRGVARPTRGGTPPPSKTKAPRPPDADQRGGGRGDGDRRGSESTPGQRKPVRARPAHPSRGGGGASPCRSLSAILRAEAPRLSPLGLRIPLHRAGQARCSETGCVAPDHSLAGRPGWLAASPRAADRG